MLLESEAIHANSRMDNQAVVDSGTQWLGTQVQTLRLIGKKKKKIMEGRKLSMGTNAGSGSNNKCSPSEK